MRIPKRIQLMSRTVSTVYEAELGRGDGCVGEARYRLDEIALQKDVEGYKVDDVHQIESYLHELMHWVFTMLGEIELRDNEALVERVSNLLAQAALSAEYDSEK